MRNAGPKHLHHKEFLHTISHGKRLAFGGAVPSVRANLTYSNAWGCNSVGAAMLRFSPAWGFNQTGRLHQGTMDAAGNLSSFTVIPLDGEADLSIYAAKLRVLSATLTVEPILAYDKNSGIAYGIPYVESSFNGDTEYPNPTSGNTFADPKKRIIPANRPLTWSSVPIDDMWHEYKVPYDPSAGGNNDSLIPYQSSSWESIIIKWNGLNNGAASTAALLVTVSVQVEYLPRVQPGFGWFGAMSAVNPPHNPKAIEAHTRMLISANKNGPRPVDNDTYVQQVEDELTGGLKDLATNKAIDTLGDIAGSMLATTGLTRSSQGMATNKNIRITRRKTPQQKQKRPSKGLSTARKGRKAR